MLIICNEAASSIDDNVHQTPIKNEPHSNTKKAFLRRGSSAKYDPQKARKQSLGSSQKFKYYADNFSQQPTSQIKAAPKGSSGIPSLQITSQTSASKVKVDEKAASPKKNNSSNKKSGLEKSKIDRSADEAEISARDLKSPIESNSSRLKAPSADPKLSQASSRLKFNAPAKTQPAAEEKKEKAKIKSRKADVVKSTKIEDSKKSPIVEEKKVAEKSSLSVQKTTSTRLAQNKQLFKKQTSKKVENKSVEMKEPFQPSEPAQTYSNALALENKELRVTILSDVPNEIVPISTDGASNQTPFV